MATRSHLSIGEVLELLRDEFPDVTISKIRFLESQGLLEPERTASGYRKFYEPDVDRLRYILRQQREKYLPLKVIKDQLVDGANHPDNATKSVDGPADGVVSDEPTRTYAWSAAASGALSGDRLASLPTTTSSNAGAEDPVTATREANPLLGGGGLSLTFDELVNASGLRREDLRQLEQFGLIAARQVGTASLYDEDALLVAKLAGRFQSFGIEGRHLRMYRVAADREAALFEQIVSPQLRRHNPDARQQAMTTLGELARLGDSLHAVALRLALRSAVRPASDRGKRERG